MTIIYATGSEFTQVYSIKGLSIDEISSYWLRKASLVLNERLGTYFTIPFSSNNETAKDLTIDLAFVGIQNRQRVNSGEVNRKQEEIDRRIQAIIGGNSPMVTTEGEPINSDALQMGVYSTNEDYLPTFNMLDPEQQRIDELLQEDTIRNINARNADDEF